jgi:hypothetical protein
MNKVYKIESEWDLGLEDIIFISKEDAEDCLSKIHWLANEFEGATYMELMEDGMIEIKTLKIYSK